MVINYQWFVVIFMVNLNGYFLAMVFVAIFMVNLNGY